MSISFKGDTRDSITFARQPTGHLKSLRFFHGAKTFPICAKRNDAEATSQHVLDSVDLGNGTFINSVVVQHHAFVLRTSDRRIDVACDYEEMKLKIRGAKSVRHG
ncbi:uncharacterized protein TNCV_1620501 [Trichonephila clavipes]|nr:uncharacterized protein TNCV_1620501 [Trichonephila clavipes]